MTTQHGKSIFLLSDLYIYFFFSLLNYILLFIVRVVEFVDAVAVAVFTLLLFFTSLFFFLL